MSASYNRSLDEILGFNTAAPNKSLDTRPIAPQRKNLPVDSRPISRHGRSSQSESSSSSKNEINERKVGRPNSVDVWNRDDENKEVEPNTLANGSRRTTLTRSFHQPATIPEQERPSSIESSPISSDQSSSFHDDFLVEQKPEQFETTTQPFKLTPSSSSSSSSNLSGASQRTYSTKVNDNNESLLNSSLRIHSSSSSAAESPKKEAVKEMARRSTASSVNKSPIKSPQIEEPNPTIEEKELPPKIDSKPVMLNERVRSVAKSVSKPQPRPKSSAPQPKHDLDTQRTKLKSSMSTRQLLSENSPNYNLWLQRSIKNEQIKNREYKFKKSEEERKKTERAENGKKSFDRWAIEYDQKRTANQRQKARQLKETERQKEEALKAKRLAAEKTFEHWKQTDKERRRSERMTRIQNERQRAQSAETQKLRQKEENDKAYQIWCETLNDRIREDLRIKEAQEEKRRHQLDQDKNFRDSLAKEAYELWLEMKRKDKIFSNSLAYKILDYDVEAKKRWPAPWIPTTPTVPRKFVGTGNRRRTLDKPLTIVQRRAKSIY